MTQRGARPAETGEKRAAAPGARQPVALPPAPQKFHFSACAAKNFLAHAAALR